MALEITSSWRRRWALWRDRARVSSDQDAAILRGVRLRLTLWYAGVLAAALLLAGAALYLGVDRTVFRPVDRALSMSAADLTLIWQRSPQAALNVFCAQTQPRYGLPQRVRYGPLPPRFRSLGSVRALYNRLAGQEYRACYDPKGTLVSQTRQNGGTGAFVSSSFARQVTRAAPNALVDIVNGGAGIGSVRRYAVAVPSPSGHGHGVLGVIQLGTKIDGETNTLNQLLTLLLIVGAVSLLGAVLGGLFLAGRALVPVRLAFARQQAFVADASHELRTPLTLMRADAEVLLRGREALTPDAAALLEDIVAETAHMSELTNNLLTLARLDARRVRPERDVIDLAEVARTATHRAARLAAAASVELGVESDGVIRVLGDRALLDQAALILLDNGIKYNRPGGSVTLRTAMHGGRALLAVHDTGIGIAPEHLPHLGERFYRVDKARSREAGGAGLGLSIARGIAALHGGTLSLSSVPGNGTTATLALPQLRTSVMPAQPAE